MTFSYIYLKCWSQGKVKFIICHSTLRSCRVHLRTFFGQPFSEQLYGDFMERLCVISLVLVRVQEKLLYGFEDRHFHILHQFLVKMGDIPVL